MADENPAVPSPIAVTEKPEAKAAPGPTISIGDEFGTAKRNLPPVTIVLAALAGVLIVAGAVSFFQRAKPQAGGTIVSVNAVQIPNQNAVLVAMTFSLRSAAEKSLWVKGIQGKMVTAAGEHTGEALSAMDFDRYFRAFPDLGRNAQPALAPEDKIQAGQELKRTVIVSFPVTMEEFKQHKSVSLILQAYDQPLPVVLTE
jgi:hypothetical protein